jgi:hypothetical protein
MLSGRSLTAQKLGVVKMETLDEIKLEADTLIHIGGMPFELKAGALVYGVKSNLQLVDQGRGSVQSLYRWDKAGKPAPRN